jgi:hypothetical protein
MSTLTPWALGPFEIILHAEMHYRYGEDFDRRIAVVGFDNAIEVAIHTYLNLHPIQRQNRTYLKDDVEKWLENFHTKIEFLETEVKSRNLTMACDKAKFIWYHEIRNGQYHVGGATIPQARELEGIRDAALWVFTILFDVLDVEALLEQHLASRSGDDLPKRTDDDDRLIDREYGTVELCGKPYHVSEVLHAYDPVLYSELAGDIKKRDAADEEMNKGPLK